MALIIIIIIIIIIIHQGEWSGWEGTPWDVKHVRVGLTLECHFGSSVGPGFVLRCRPLRLRCLRSGPPALGGGAVQIAERTRWP